MPKIYSRCNRFLQHAYIKQCMFNWVPVPLSSASVETGIG